MFLRAGRRLPSLTLLQRAVAGAADVAVVYLKVLLVGGGSNGELVAALVAGDAGVALLFN